MTDANFSPRFIKIFPCRRQFFYIIWGHFKLSKKFQMFLFSKLSLNPVSHSIPIVLLKASTWKSLIPLAYVVHIQYLGLVGETRDVSGWGLGSERWEGRKGVFFTLNLSVFQNILPTFQFSPDKNPALGMGTKMFGECKEYCGRKREPLYFLLCN